MPSPAAILAHLTWVSNTFWPIAMVWHIVLYRLLAGLLVGRRPSVRLAATACAAPLVSVALVAALHGNPFNAMTFGSAAVILGVLGAMSPDGLATRGSNPMVAAGAVLLVLASVYPHFVDVPNPLAWLLVAPLGVVPCPTLAGVIGLALLTAPDGTRLWRGVLAAMGLLYGLIGALRLGVAMDLWLLAGAVVLGVQALAGLRTLAVQSPRTA